MTKQEATLFRRNVKKLMATNKTTGIQLADYVGVNSSTVSEWLSGKYLPSGIRINKIAKYFHVSVSYLIGKETAPYKAPESITNIQEAIDFLTYINVLKGVDVSTKTDEEWIMMAMSIHAILKMNGMI